MEGERVVGRRRGSGTDVGEFQTVSSVLRRVANRARCRCSGAAAGLPGEATGSTSPTYSDRTADTFKKPHYI